MMSLITPIVHEISNAQSDHTQQTINFSLLNTGWYLLLKNLVGAKSR